MVKKQTKIMNTTQQLLTNLFRARFPFIYIPSWEESRVFELISEIAHDKENIRKVRELFVWSSTNGLVEIVEDKCTKKDNIKTVMEALDFIDNYNGHALLILKDIHYMFGVHGRATDYDLIRKIRDVANSLKNADFSKNVVIVAPTLILPDELQKDITVVDFDLPTLEEIKDVLTNKIIQSNVGANINLSEDDKDKLCKAAQGLTAQEAENAFARALITNRQLTAQEIGIILDEKCQVIKKTGILEFIKSELNMNDVGGLENLKRWLEKRNNSWSGKAQRDYNLPAPKGVLITGVPGCGKSLTAKAMSTMWQLPLLRLDVGKIFAGVVGSSEENMRKAIKTAEAVAPSILWIDEIEKGFGGTGSENDGGTSTRVFGTFLTWLQEKTKPVFVIATANNINRLPSEMLRKGRFDEIFFVDLPTTTERKSIFKLHLAKRLKDSISSDFDVSDSLLQELADNTEGFVGAEIEQVVIAALFEAFSEDRHLETEDLFRVIRNTVPLSTTQSEQIIAIREWANERAVAATKQSDRNEYSQEETQQEQAKKKQKEKTTKEIKRSRGGRQIDY